MTDRRNVGVCLREAFGKRLDEPGHFSFVLRFVLIESQRNDDLNICWQGLGDPRGGAVLVRVDEKQLYRVCSINIFRDKNPCKKPGKIF